MTPFKLLEDETFREKLDMMHWGYIKKCYADANREAPIPETLVPLSFSDAKVQKGLNQLRQGAKNALFAYTRHLNKN